MKLHGIEFVELQNCQTKMYVALAKITPSIALKMLDESENYRLTDVRRVSAYTAVMGKDDWEVNGETIKLDNDGRAVDGKHRLEACIKSKAPFTSLIVLGVEDVLEADRGKPRSLADHLNRLGYKNRTHLAAAICFVYRWEAAKTLYTQAVDTYPTIAQADDVLSRHPDLELFVHMARRTSRVTGPSTIASVAYVGSLVADVDATVAEEWIDGIACGVEGNHRDPRHVLREMLLQDKAQASRAVKARRTYKEKLAICIKAWNAFVLERDSTVATIRWRSGGARPEAFPSFVEKHEVAALC
jgi:hypothetical protein